MATKMMGFSIASVTALALLVGGVFGGVQALDMRYVGIEQFEDLSVEVFFQQYYDTLDRKNAAERNGDFDYALELTRRLERLKSKICKVEPDWERCDRPG